MKTKITLMAAIPALLLAVVGYAQLDRATHPIELDTVTKTWKVTAVDPANRTVTFTNEAGESAHLLSSNARCSGGSGFFS